MHARQSTREERVAPLPSPLLSLQRCRRVTRASDLATQLSASRRCRPGILPLQLVQRKGTHPCCPLVASSTPRGGNQHARNPPQRVVPQFPPSLLGAAMRHSGMAPPLRGQSVACCHAFATLSGLVSSPPPAPRRIPSGQDGQKGCSLSEPPAGCWHLLTRLGANSRHRTHTLHPCERAGREGSTADPFPRVWVRVCLSVPRPLALAWGCV